MGVQEGWRGKSPPGPGGVTWDMGAAAAPACDICRCCRLCMRVCVYV